MRVGNFSVQVPEGKERESGHVCLRHNTQYTVRLGNHCYDRRCDARVTIDGKDMGSYRINAGATCLLERAFHDHGKFTFFEASTGQAQVSGLSGIAVQDRGLMTVVFRPEKKLARPMGGILRGMNFSATPTSCEASFGEKTSAGITGLTGHSDQAFYEVPNLDYDPVEEVVVHLRLVVDASVRELKPIAKSNPIPAAV